MYIKYFEYMIVIEHLRAIGRSFKNLSVVKGTRMDTVS